MLTPIAKYFEKFAYDPPPEQGSAPTEVVWTSVAGFYPCPGAGVSLLHTSTGFGDGSYRAFTLTDGAEPVGFELVFLTPGQGCFEDDGDESN